MGVGWGDTCLICPQVEKPPLNSFRANANQLHDCLVENFSLQMCRLGGDSTHVRAAYENKTGATLVFRAIRQLVTTALSEEEKPLRVSEKALLLSVLMLLGGSDIGSRRKHTQLNAHESRRGNVHQLGLFIVLKMNDM